MTTENIVDDIPTKVGQQMKGLPALESMKIALHNLTYSQEHLDQGNTFCLCFTIGIANRVSQE